MPDAAAGESHGFEAIHELGMSTLSEVRSILGSDPAGVARIATATFMLNSWLAFAANLSDIAHQTFMNGNTLVSTHVLAVSVEMRGAALAGATRIAEDCADSSGHNDFVKAKSIRDETMKRLQELQDQAQGYLNE